MKKLLLTLTDQDQEMVKEIKELYRVKTETAAIRLAIKQTYDNKETIQRQLFEDMINQPQKDWRVGPDLIKELDPGAKEILLRELYDRLTAKK